MMYWKCFYSCPPATEIQVWSLYLQIDFQVDKIKCQMWFLKKRYFQFDCIKIAGNVGYKVLWNTGKFNYFWSIQQVSFTVLKPEACFICDLEQHSALTVYLHCKIKFFKWGSGHWLIYVFLIGTASLFFYVPRSITINCSLVLRYVFYFTLCYTAVGGTRCRREMRHDSAGTCGNVIIVALYG